ncbi:MULTISPECIES: NAD(P)H-dependent oxidoreductase [unclassified Flavobacterium]|uniref:NAD(P)H-dependent oxidoreductase n=1 Tax=unclassified Flavobacterium TaxID=196869 RepID=UPI001F12938F|nr:MULTISPECIES: NAD(P)H-dependent oxidoreductase [unclassified Flavobacterium]UMY65122.1 NAD(P)H-dependent oxidoreductase [Flavobacterium sp. HJ-32-4]
MSLLTDLNWRYATKKYDPTRKITGQQLDTIIEAARLAPSSYGLQPYRVLAIGNQELKDKIVPIAWNQQLVADCSHLLVFAAWDGYDSGRISKIFDHTTDQRGIDRGMAFGLHTDAIVASQVALDHDSAFVDTAKQACISLGMAIAQAAELRIDNSPLGGFNNDELDKLLDLPAKGLKSVYLLALGYRQSQGDWLVNLKKVRTPKEEFLITYY